MALRRTRLNPISEKQRAKKAEAAARVAEEGAAFRAAIFGLSCVVCGSTAGEARRAGTRHQAHHAISQQRLRKLGLDDWLWDPRLAVCVCEEPCHRRHTSARSRIRRMDLPPAVFDFASEHGIFHVIEREYP